MMAVFALILMLHVFGRMCNTNKRESNIQASRAEYEAAAQSTVLVLCKNTLPSLSEANMRWKKSHLIKSSGLQRFTENENCFDVCCFKTDMKNCETIRPGKNVVVGKELVQHCWKQTSLLPC